MGIIQQCYAFVFLGTYQPLPYRRFEGTVAGPGSRNISPNIKGKTLLENVAFITLGIPPPLSIFVKATRRRSHPSPGFPPARHRGQGL